MRRRKGWLVFTFLVFLAPLIQAQHSAESAGETSKAKVHRSTFRDPVTAMEFVWVPGGTFEMGCHANAGPCNDREKPAHGRRVEGFWMAAHEVTQGQWQKIMGYNRSKFKKGSRYPVERVTWDEIQIFLQKLNKRSSTTFRLPSEVEWEYACREGGKFNKYGWGPGEPGSGDRRQANLADKQTRFPWRLRNYDDGYAETAPVATYPPNALGLYDMSGNVWEWVQNKKYTYPNAPTSMSRYKLSPFARMYRGGSWLDSPVFLRCTVRRNFNPSFNYSYLGFRLARSK